MNKQDRVFFPNLDGFRFLSFLIVFLLHGFAAVINSHPVDGFIATTFTIAFFQSGQLGVSFFFVLSGFLITYLILVEKQKLGSFDIKAFYVRRSLRIFPLYFAYLILVFLAMPWFSETPLPNPFYYFFFLSNFHVINSGGGHSDYLNITWSVSVEEQFYLVWAVLFLVVKPRFYTLMFLAIIAGSAIFRFLNSSDSLTVNFHTLSVVSELAIGGLVAHLAVNKSWFCKAFEEMPRWMIISAYFWIIPMLVFSRFLYGNPTIGRIVLGFAIAFIISEQNFSKSSFYKMKNFASISALGKYTYGLYLLHPLVIIFVSYLAILLGLSENSLPVGVVVGVISLFLSVFVCYLSYHYFESPFLKLKSKFIRVRTGVALSGEGERA